MNKWGHVFITLCLVLSAVFPAFADMVLDEDFKHQQLGIGGQYFEDKTAQRTYDEMLQEDLWKVSGSNGLSFGFTTSAFWIKTKVVNPLDKHRLLYLQVDNPFLDDIQVYFVSETGVESLFTGDTIPVGQRPVRHTQHLIPFYVNPTEQIELYVRVQSKGAMQIPLAIWDSQSFVESDHLSSLLYGLFFWLLLTISVYHFFLFISIKERAYLNYSLFYLSLLGVYACLSGIPGVFFWPMSPRVSDTFLIMCMGLSVYFPCMFAFEVLAVKTSRPTLGFTMRCFGFAGLFIACIASFMPYVFALKLLLAAVLCSIVINFIVYIVRFFDGYPPAKYMLMSVFFASIGLGVTVFVKVGALPSNFLTENALSIGVSFMAMLHAFALSQRINMNRAELALVHKALLDAKQKANEDLDHLVQARTYELEQVNEKLKLLSTTDPLTKLGNRRYFDELYRFAFRQCHREKEPISLLLLDIDHFKHINDTYGHQFGDACLIEAAKHILSCVRRPQDTVARYGGEEFVVLLPNTPLDGAVCIAELIVGRFREAKIFYAGAEIMMTVSIGVVSVIPCADLNEDHLLSKADKLLYRAKKNGRNRVEWEPPIQPEESFTLDLN
ncbi:sensor domain-containing diguanylate cyclase [Neptunomonas phycophila]|uniref:sensor domain-containing diguanylate cyclase n=1 Tax=Neptunomonas phycophila TaxID=1572645 RepID=UPI003516C644